MVELMKHQEDAVEALSNGKILWGGVGAGKSRAVLAYYMAKERGRDIVVVTTAKKRDTLEWEGEAAAFGISVDPKLTNSGQITIDSWNNISKYERYEDCFFIFDEQRLVGNGAWVKSFIKIARKNRWVLLTATPGDTWMDYAPVFIANGFYENITRFKLEHVVYEAFSKYPKIKMYLNESKLEQLRNHVLVEMPFIKHTNRIINWLEVGYDREQFRRVFRDRWNIYKDEPIHDISEMFRVLRKLVNSDPSRLETVKFLMTLHPRLVIFYTFDYELEILRTLGEHIEVAEWNGHRKDPLPVSDNWVYLVQYTSGAEGWNCTSTDAMIMYSLTYSYKNFIQAQGRIDRMDTKYIDLFYYVLYSDSMIDRAIRGSLSAKKNFNQRRFLSNLSRLNEFVKT